MQNDDKDPTKLREQVSKLRDEVVKMESETIEKTANELLAVHDDMVRVLGTAYTQSHIDADDQKGILG